MQNKTLICLAIAAVFAFVIYKMYKKEKFQLERAKMTGNTAMASIAADDQASLRTNIRQPPSIVVKGYNQYA